MLVIGPAAPARAKSPRVIQTHETRSGEILFLKLPGDPSLGYKWRLNKDLSEGLDLVKVEEVGWLMAQKGRSMFFQAQSTLNVAVWTLGAGQANLAFDYYRRISGRIHSRTSVVRIRIKPRLASQ